MMDALKAAAKARAAAAAAAETSDRLPAATRTAVTAAVARPGRGHGGGTQEAVVAEAGWEPWRQGLFSRNKPGRDVLQ